MAVTMTIETFIRRMRMHANDAARLFMNAQDINSVFLDNDFATQVTQNDLDGAGIDVKLADLGDYITFCQATVALRDNQAVTSMDAGAVINAVRLE